MIGVTVCVNYSHLLHLVIDRWSAGLDKLIVVTSSEDEGTHELCSYRRNVIVINADDILFGSGASFNKGGALNMAASFAVRIASDWVSVFDADILPPEGWQAQVDGLTIGNLYGSFRYKKSGEREPDPDYEWPGYFWIFHSSDTHIPSPIFTSWKHAGNYDTIFHKNWPNENKVRLDLRLTHLSVPGKNWWGVGNENKMREMYEERARRGGMTHYDHESIS